MGVGRAQMYRTAVSENLFDSLEVRITMPDQRVTVPREIPCEVDEGMPKFKATITSERFGETNWFREWIW